MKHVIVLIGPPGSGKSTIAEELSKELKLVVIATGKRLRQEIASGSPIGREIEPLLEQGHFAPDTLMDQLMREWLAAVPADSLVLLDGYPRSTRQAMGLESMLADTGQTLSMVIALEVNDEEVIHRLSGRRICEGGGEAFTLHADDAEAVQRCRERGGTLTQRDDDQPEIISERLRVYASETEPLLDYYTRNGLLRHVDASGSPAEVAERVAQLLR
jgi:adenylate kinase